jgi:hypothetical protein
MEEFRELEQYPGYKIGNRGTILGYYKKPLAHTRCVNGYKYVSIVVQSKHKTVLLHRLIGLAWICNPENKSCIDHINRDRGDNRIENLRWVTKIENGQNPSIRANNKSKTTGLSFIPSKNLWAVQKQIFGKPYRRCFKERADAEEYLRLITGQH